MPTLEQVDAEYRACGDRPGRRMDLVRGTMDMVLDVDCVALEEWLTWVIGSEADPIVRHEAVFAAGALVGFGALTGVTVFPVIVRGTVAEESVVVRHESVEALCNFHTLESVAASAAALADPHIEVSATARITLERIADRSEDAEVSRAATEALATARTG